jgi:hypothetical protein
MADQASASPPVPICQRECRCPNSLARPCLGHVGDDEIVLVRSGSETLRSVRIAAITTGRSPRAS